MDLSTSGYMGGACGGAGGGGQSGSDNMPLDMDMAGQQVVEDGCPSGLDPDYGEFVPVDLSRLLSWRPLS